MKALRNTCTGAEVHTCRNICGHMLIWKNEKFVTTQVAITTKKADKQWYGHFMDLSAVGKANVSENYRLTGRRPWNTVEWAKQEQNMYNVVLFLQCTKVYLVIHLYIYAGTQRKIWKDTMSKAISLRNRVVGGHEERRNFTFTLYISTLFDFFSPNEHVLFYIFEKTNTF